jgi:hypothetical protein
MLPATLMFQFKNLVNSESLRFQIPAWSPFCRLVPGTGGRAAATNIAGQDGKLKEMSAVAHATRDGKLAPTTRRRLQGATGTDTNRYTTDGRSDRIGLGNPFCPR